MNIKEALKSYGSDSDPRDTFVAECGPGDVRPRTRVIHGAGSFAALLRRAIVRQSRNPTPAASRGTPEAMMRDIYRKGGRN